MTDSFYQLSDYATYQLSLFWSGRFTQVLLYLIFEI